MSVSKSHSLEKPRKDDTETNNDMPSTTFLLLMTNKKLYDITLDNDLYDS